MQSPATMLFRGPADSGASRAARLGLSPELLRRVRARLRGVLLVMLIVVAASLVVTILVGSKGRSAAEMFELIVGTAVTVFAVAVGYLVMRVRAVRDDVAVWLGFGFELFLACSASLGNFVGYYAEHGHLPMISWTVGVMLVFPLVVPRPARLTLVLAVLAGAAMPGMAWFLHVSGDIVLQPGELRGLAINGVFAAGIAFFTSRVAYGLSVDADRARQMGSYHLEEKLGAGGMGEVWLASHRMLARPAAVKLIHPDASPDAATLQRFEREAQVTASLKSSHTIGLYDFGVTEDGSFYYVMELLDGIDLETLVEKFGPVRWQRAVHILTQACDSLAEAHEADLVHRDIKPANIMVARHGREHDLVKVLDFGLVGLQAEWDTGDDRLTRDGVVGGTPAYMAPEVTRGKPVDARTDLYALGCVGFWLLTGERVFSADTALAVMVAHASDEPRRISEVAESDVPAPLEELVHACLAKDPAERPASADELARSLAAIPSDSPWTSDRARLWWQQHRPATVANRAS